MGKKGAQKRIFLKWQGRPPKAGFKNRSETRTCKSIDGAHPPEKRKRELNPGKSAKWENPEAAPVQVRVELRIFIRSTFLDPFHYSPFHIPLPSLRIERS